MAKEKHGTPGVTWAHASRDVLVAAINRGQLLLLLLGAIILLLIWKMPSADAGVLANKLVDDLSNYSLIGWLLFLVALGGWYVHAKSQRTAITAEMKRLGDERSKLQDQTLGGRVKSSMKGKP